MLPRFALVALFVLVPCTAFAADPPRDPAAAQALFSEARALMEQGRYAQACPKLEESSRLDAGIEAELSLADCNEHLGKTASAWAGFLAVAAQAKASNLPEREKVARKRALALEKQLPKVVIEVSSAPPGLEVKRDGVLLVAAAWNMPIPVDSGLHRITASAPGKETWEMSVQATNGKTVRVQVPQELPAAAIVAPAPTGPSSFTEGASTTVTSASTDGSGSFPPPIIEGRFGQRTLGWIVTGVGGAAIGVGAGFGLASLGKRDESNGHCVGDTCDSAGVALRDDAIRNGNIATITTIAGGALLAGGLVLVLTAPKDRAPRERPANVRAAPTAAIGGGGLMIMGAFQ